MNGDIPKISFFKTTKQKSETVLQQDKKELDVVSQHMFSRTFLVSQVEQFKGGNISCSSIWCKITKDKYILDIVYKGLKLNFSSIPPNKGPFEYPRQTVDKEDEKLLQKQVIEPCISDSGEYFSNLFIAPEIS